MSSRIFIIFASINLRGGNTDSACEEVSTKTWLPLWPPARRLHLPDSFISLPVNIPTDYSPHFGKVRNRSNNYAVDGCCLSCLLVAADSSVKSHENFGWTHHGSQQSEDSPDAANLPCGLKIASRFSRKCSFRSLTEQTANAFATMKGKISWWEMWMLKAFLPSDEFIFILTSESEPERNDTKREFWINI